MDWPVATMKQNVDLTYNTRQAFFSDVELIAGMKKSQPDSPTAKSGMDFIPYMSNFYPTEFNEILFYFELYNTDAQLSSDDAFIMKYFIEDSNNELIQEGCAKVSREKTGPVITELGRFDISALRSGKYNIRLEARSKENELFCFREHQIIRENKNAPELTPEQIDLTFVGGFDNKDSLWGFLETLIPIAEESELNVIDNYTETMTLLEMKSFFYNFWERRNPIDPESVWQDYEVQVAEAQEKFGTRVKPGYRTDMGRVFLKYGPPNTVVNDANDSESYPYQIWHYYKAGKYSEGRFVFYDESLLLSDYMLLHSDVPGERRNPRWNRIIHSRNNPMNSFDDQGAPGESSRRLQELYDSPR